MNNHFLKHCLTVAVLINSAMSIAQISTAPKSINSFVSGFYVGGGLGTLINRSSIDDTYIYIPAPRSGYLSHSEKVSNNNDYQNTSLLGELFVGYIKFIKHVGFGLEVSAKYHHFNQNYGGIKIYHVRNPGVVASEIDYTRSMSASLGFNMDAIAGALITPSNFLYGFIGFDINRFGYNFNCVMLGINIIGRELLSEKENSQFHRNYTKKSFSIGVGLDHQIGNNLKLGAKIRFTAYPEASFKTPIMGAGTMVENVGSFDFNEKSNAISISMRVSYTF